MTHKKTTPTIDDVYTAMEDLAPDGATGTVSPDTAIAYLQLQQTARLAAATERLGDIWAQRVDLARKTARKRGIVKKDDQ